MSKKLVAFFSASGTTKKVAEMIAEEAKANLFEIEPKVPYTKADLDWMDKKSRSSVEMSDKKYRPEIMKKKMDMSSYDEILFFFCYFDEKAKRQREHEEMKELQQAQKQDE